MTATITANSSTSSPNLPDGLGVLGRYSIPATPLLKKLGTAKCHNLMMS
jgi:hypothetical protein